MDAWRPTTLHEAGPSAGNGGTILSQTIVLTRPAAQGRGFAREIRARGIGGAVLFSPVLTIVPLGAGSLPPGDIAVTSLNGVAAAGVALAGRHVFAVGGRTAAAARAMGARVSVAGGDVAALAELIGAARPASVTHLHGRHVRGNLVGRLDAMGIAAAGVVIYDQVERPLSGAAQAAITGDAAVILPLFSPRSARLVAGQVGPTGPRLRVLAMSAAVAAHWPLGGDIRVAARPAAAAVLDLVVSLVADSSGR